MKDLYKNGLFKMGIPLILLVLLVVVVGFGQIKQNKISKQLLSELSSIEKSKSSGAVVKDKNQEDKNKTVAATQSLDKKDYTYQGVNALGNYNNTRWKNKKWYVLGDGMSAANNYQSKVKTMCAMSEVINDAKANRLMGDLLQNVTTEKLKDVSIITVFAGTNDYAFNTQLGTMNDSQDANTFYGNLKKIINGILKEKTDANIVFLTPLKRGVFMNEPVYPNPNKAGYMLEDYVQAIKDVCKSYNILVLDTFNKSGITEKNLKEYTVDNLSLNEKGYQKISQVISDYFKTINNQQLIINN
jgi:lysophospholipase L1-like esterase